MSDKLQKLFALRRFVLAQVEGLNVAQLNHIPAGYRNNIVWNLAHLGAAVQSLSYGRAGLPFTMPEAYVTPYLPGTQPETTLDKAALTALTTAGLEALDQLALDVAAGQFAGYTPSPFLRQRYGMEVASINDALEFLLFHEGFHTGYILALKHLV